MKYYSQKMLFKKAQLYYIEKYKEYLQSGISYNQLRMLMEYDYNLCLLKCAKKMCYDSKREKTENDEIRYNELCNIETNMKSIKDAACKIDALRLAKEELDGEKRTESIKKYLKACGEFYE